MYNTAMRSNILFKADDDQPLSNLPLQAPPVIQNQLNLAIAKLLSTFQTINEKKSHTGGSTIHVDEIASQIAKMYEKIRKIIDWKEENLLRRSAIERIIKRGMIGKISNITFFNTLNLDTFSEEMVLELIRGGHLLNDVIQKDVVIKVKEILTKYLNIIEQTPFSKADIKRKINFYDWLMAIGACEIEEILAPPLEENALIEAMTESINQRIVVLPKKSISPEDQYIQTYIATYRTLYDLDDSIISYNLLKKKYSDINAKNIFLIQDELSEQLTHPLRKQFYNTCEKYDTIFTLLEDVLKKYKDTPVELNNIVVDKQKFRDLITELYNIRHKSLKKRLFKLAVFSTLSVFVANWFTFFIVEIPLAHIFYEGFNPLATTIDFFVPSVAMFIIVSLIKPPGKSNLNTLLAVMEKYIYTNDDKDIYEIKIKKKKSFITRFIIFLFYFVGCLSSFWFIAWAFFKATLPITSVIFDTFTIALNIFAALVIRNKSREINVEENTTFGEFILDIFSLPMAEIGSWLANKWKEYNVVAVFFNLAVEVPIISFIGFVENWRQFIKDKKADIH